MVNRMDKEKQIIDLPGTRCDTLWAIVESGRNDDGIEWEKRQRTAPKTFESCIFDKNGICLDTKLTAMQEQINEAASAIHEINTSPSNPNLLINPNFKINQRGKTTYSIHDLERSLFYTMDRWALEYNYLDGKENLDISIMPAPLSGTAFFVNKAASFVNFYQAIKMDEIDLRGKTVTFSFYIGECSGHKGFFIQTYYNNIYNVIAEGTITEGNKIYTCTVTIPPNNIDFIKFGFNCNGLGLQGALNINWAKLELGSYTTPFIPPDPTIELLKCQRYYIQTKSSQLIGIIPPTEETVTLLYNFPIIMRATPTINIPDNTILSFYYPMDGTFSVNDLNAIFISDSAVALRTYAKSPLLGQTGKTCYIESAIGFDAEIY